MRRENGAAGRTPKDNQSPSMTSSNEATDRLSKALRLQKKGLRRTDGKSGGTGGFKVQNLILPKKSCILVWCTLNMRSWVKRPPAGVVGKFGEMMQAQVHS
ncbi:hypothetical protein AVEN_257442-1 [Araneus ventricosus]|uniref:Uncharacterized protein n=1 Tax=Araneus ventricosus TaxID=182803 RepID=A0A4Y2FCQ0_ARAVE|nr:hypothetical protein AVEN_257442-1 [Araneus ventricosus]